MSENIVKNDGLKEVGKGFIALANLFLIIFLLNNYLQKESFSIIAVILSIYTFFMLYLTGYKMINRGDTNDWDRNYRSDSSYNGLYGFLLLW